MIGRLPRLAALCGLLAACAPQQPGVTGDASAAATATAPAAGDAEENDALAGQAPQPEAEKETETAALPTPPPIDDDPQQLMGLTRADLGSRLGAPELVRHESPAEIWQYRIEDCVFDVFLYDQRVAYLEARDRKANAIDARGCLNQLLRARKSAPLG